nr:hypothetical protein [Tanacetum cinerariifolium]
MKIPLLEYFASVSSKWFPLSLVTPIKLLKKKQQVKVLQKKGRTIVITTEDMRKRRNDVKVRTTLLLALPNEHQLRFSKYETAKELWEAILKTFGGNEATQKTKKNQLKQQYGNFKVKGSENLEQTFNRLQAIVSHLEFINVEIKQDDLNKKFLTSLAPEWLIYTIVWRNRDDLDTMSLDYLYNHLKVYEPEVQKKSESNSQNIAFISLANTSSRKAASISHDTVCAYIASQSNGFQIKYEDITQIDKDDIEEMDIKAPRSQDRGRRESYKQENHALVANDEAPTEFVLMAKSSSSSENEVESRLVEFKTQEIKFYENIRGLELDVEFENNKIEYLMNELEQVKKEKEDIDRKLIGFESASKDLDTLLGNQRTDKNKDGLGYNVVPPTTQVYSPPKKDMSWTGLPEFADDTITDYSRPTPSIESNTSNLQNSNSSVFEHGESSSSIMSKPMIKFVNAADCPRFIKTNNTKNARKSTVKYVEMYRNTSKSPKVRGNQQNWNNLKSQQFRKDFMMHNKACYIYGSFDHL